MYYRVTFDRIGRHANPEPIIVKVEDGAAEEDVSQRISDGVLAYVKTGRSGRRFLFSRAIYIDVTGRSGIIHAGDRFVGSFAFERTS
jgi:ribosomal protein L35AE/L33A